MELWSGNHLIDTDVTWSSDRKVIVINDQEYIKPCGQQVVNFSYCVKPEGHQSSTHEDTEGRVRWDEMRVRQENWKKYDEEFKKAVSEPLSFITYLPEKKKSNPIDIKWFLVGSLAVIPLWLIFTLLAFRM